MIFLQRQLHENERLEEKKELHIKIYLTISHAVL